MATTLSPGSGPAARTPGPHPAAHLPGRTITHQQQWATPAAPQLGRHQGPSQEPNNNGADTQNNNTTGTAAAAPQQQNTSKYNPWRTTGEQLQQQLFEPNTTHQYGQANWGMGRPDSHPGWTNNNMDYMRGMQTTPQPELPPYPQGGQQQNTTLPPVIDPSWLQLISSTVLAMVASMQQSNGTQNGVSLAGTLTLTTRSAKLLNGTNKFSLLGFCGHSIQDSQPEIFIILDSNEDTTTKFHALEDRLTMVQCNNPFVHFTLRQATYADMQKHLFHFAPHEKHMMRGFTPFCLQKMEQTNEISLRLLEEKM